MDHKNHTLYHEQLEQAATFINTHDHFLVVSHVHPDGDAISSTCAMGLLLEKLNKSFVLVNEHSVPSKFNYLMDKQHIHNSTEFHTHNKFNCVISVDCADFSRIGTASSLFSADSELLNIDHHHTNDNFGTMSLIHSQAAATVQIIYDLSIYLNIEMDLRFYNCIYTGLCTDTGGFRYSNTTEDVLQIATHLIHHGVNGSDISYRVLEILTKSQILLLQSTLPSLQLSDDDRIAWMCVTARDITKSNALYEDLEGLVQYPRSIEGVEIGILFKEVEQDEVKVSLRSQKYVDVSKIAKYFGGGGHMRASGCVIKGKLEDVVRQVVSISGKELI